MVISTDKRGRELVSLDCTSIDIDLNDTKDFVANIPEKNLPYIESGGRFFVEGTEFGGIIKGLEIQTATNEYIVSGLTWRGILDKKVIEPDGDYKTVSGTLTEVTSQLITEAGLGGLFVVGNEVENETTYQFKRYCTLYEGLVELLAEHGYRLDLLYIQGEGGEAGHVNIDIVPIKDLSELIELSQDCQLDFILSVKEGVNHLICLGKGELAERTVVHLYIQEDGSVGTSPYYTGIEEVAEIYDNANAETEEELTRLGRAKLKSLWELSYFDMDIAKLSIDAGIGDIVGGRDYITGTYMAKPIANKIYKLSNGIETVESKLKGEV